MPTSESHEGIILIADDNEANRELLSALLSAEGYQVVCATDGQQALARVDSAPRRTARKQTGDREQARRGNLLPFFPAPAGDGSG